MRRYSAPPSVVLAAKIYAEEFLRALDEGAPCVTSAVATMHTMERTGLSDGMVRLCSRLAMEMLREQREVRWGDLPNVRTGVSGQPVRRLRPVGHHD